jgi:hypothetical protein
MFKMRVPARHTADAIKNLDVDTEINGRWYLARPLPYYHWKQRWTLAWAVFRGKADAVFWVGQ